MTHIFSMLVSIHRYTGEINDLKNTLTLMINNMREYTSLILCMSLILWVNFFSQGICYLNFPLHRNVWGQVNLLCLDSIHLHKQIRSCFKTRMSNSGMLKKFASGCFRNVHLLLQPLAYPSRNTNPTLYQKDFIFCTSSLYHVHHCDRVSCVWFFLQEIPREGIECFQVRSKRLPCLFRSVLALNTAVCW